MLRHPLLTAPAAVAVAVLALPIAILVALAPWADLGEVLASPLVLRSLALSAGTVTAATAIVGLLGIPLGILLARDPRLRVVRPLVWLAVLLPPVVAGVALQRVWGADGLLGPALRAVGIDAPGGAVGVVLAQVFVALPLCALVVEAGVRAVDPRVEEVARVHGMRGVTLLRRCTLPLARPAVSTGLLVASVRALGELGATLAVVDAVGQRTLTVPLAVHDALRADPAAARLLSVLLLGMSALVLVLVRGRLRIVVRPPSGRGGPTDVGGSGGP